MKKLALTLSLLISGANLTAGEKVASPDGGIIVDFNLSHLFGVIPGGGDCETFRIGFPPERRNSYD